MYLLNFTEKKKKSKIFKENSVNLVELIKNIIDNFDGKYNDKYSFKSFFIDSNLEDPERIIEWEKE